MPAPIDQQLYNSEDFRNYLATEFKASGAADYYEWERQNGERLYQNWFASRGQSANPDQQAAAVQHRDAIQPQVKEKTREELIREQLDAFVKWANRPLDQMMQDPEVQQWVQSAQSSVRTNDRLAGVEGGMSNLNSQKAAYDASLAIHNQRRQMGLSAMGMQIQDVNQVNALNEQARQFDVAGYNANLQQQYAQNMQGYQVAGGVLGGIGGGLLGFGLSGGNPLAAGYGAAAGSQVGAGLAGSMAGPPPKFSPSVPSNYTPSGGLSGRNF